MFLNTLNWVSSDLYNPNSQCLPWEQRKVKSTFENSNSYDTSKFMKIGASPEIIMKCKCYSDNLESLSDTGVGAICPLFPLLSTPYMDTSLHQRTSNDSMDN